MYVCTAQDRPKREGGKGNVVEEEEGEEEEKTSEGQGENTFAALAGGLKACRGGEACGAGVGRGRGLGPVPRLAQRLACFF